MVASGGSEEPVQPPSRLACAEAEYPSLTAARFLARKRERGGMMGAEEGERGGKESAAV